MGSFPGSILLSGADVLKTTTGKINPLGTRGYTRDGRVFRYTRNGATALKPGLPVQSSVPLAGALAVGSGTTELKANTSKVSVITGSTGVFTTRNAFADGYLWLRTSSTSKGAAVYAQIKSNTTQTATATGKVVFDFHSGDALYSATTNIGTTNVTIGIIRNEYDKVVVKPSGIITAPVVGVPVRPVAANAYFWLQTWGPCPVRCDATAVKIGYPVGASTNTSARYIGVNSTKPTSGASVGTWTVINNIIGGLGTAMVVGVSGEYRTIFLKVAP